MAKEEEIQFIEYDEPALDVGSYTVTISQKIQNEIFQTTETYAVFGERYSINPANIHAMFPPSGSLGLYTEVIPHISLNKDTFIWERSPFSDDSGDGYPWLALLVFDESEFDSDAILAPEIIKISELNNGKAKYPKFTMEEGNEPNDKLVVIDVKKSLLQNVLPTSEELRLQAHIRKRVNENAEVAVLMSNRLPRAGANTTVHLVSVENRYKKQTGFNYQNAGQDDYIRLVSLKSWSFACPIRFKITPKCLANLKADAAFKANKQQLAILNEFEEEGKVYEGQKKFETLLENTFIDLIKDKTARETFIALIVKYAKYTRTFEQLVEEMNTGNLLFPVPDKANSQLKSYLEKGYLALPHKLRQCDKTYSWYHGPFTPFYQSSKFKTAEFKDLPDFADSLTIYLPELGMFDMSYAAAYQLGRSVALKDKIFAKSLYQWKYTYNQVKALEQQQKDVDDLVGLEQNLAQDTNAEGVIKTWFKNIGLLDDLPFNYLVPDEKMLPEESIRFFSLDEHWIECLLYGAFTIGGPIRTITDNPKEEELKKFQELITTYPTQRSGFIIRSQMVSGWPDLMVEGFDVFPDSKNVKATIAGIPLKILRRENIAPDVMVCVFEGDIKTVDLYLKPEGLHFGVDEKEDGTYDKDLQFQKGSITIPLKQEDVSKKILNMKVVADNLATEIKQTITSAQFGMEMIDGSSKGRFVKNN